MPAKGAISAENEGDYALVASSKGHPLENMLELAWRQVHGNLPRTVIRTETVSMLATMQHTVATRLLTEITEAEALAAGRLIAATWPHHDRGAPERAEQLLSRGREYTGPVEQTPRSLLVRDGERVIAHALVFGRTIGTQDGERDVMALAMVTTDLDYRGQGLGGLVARAAFDWVDQGVFEASLFQTTVPVESFYEQLGACRIENRIVNSRDDSAPDKCPFNDELAMRYPATAEWPTGTIDLLGPGY